VVVKNEFCVSEQWIWDSLDANRRITKCGMQTARYITL